MCAEWCADLCVCLRVHACVYACLTCKKSKSWMSRLNFFKTQYFHTRYRQNPRHHFFWRTGGVTDWEFTYCVLRERVFRCERQGYLWMSSSKEIVCCQLQTPCFSDNKSTKKLIQNTRKCCLRTLLMSGFQIFAATKKNALSFPDFCQKAWNRRFEAFFVQPIIFQCCYTSRRTYPSGFLVLFSKTITIQLS